MNAALILLLTLTCGPSDDGAQEKDWKKALENALADREYSVTKVDRAQLVDGPITAPGAVLTVLQPGLSATDSGAVIVRFSRVRAGVVTNPQSKERVGTSYVYEVGQQVYLRDISVDDDKIDVKVITVEPVQRTLDGAVTARRYLASLRFEFDKGFLRSATSDQVIQAIKPVLATRAEMQSRRTIELGHTADQVIAVLGKPESITKSGQTMTYLYKTMKVVFTNGKVSDVQ